MDEEVLTQAESIADLLGSQLEVVLAMLSRPAVQRQILTVLIILLIAWGLPEGIRRWRIKRRESDEMDEREAAESTEVEPTATESSGVTATRTLRQRLLPALYNLLTPILALALLALAVRLFDQVGYPSGLLDNLAVLIWIWLFYRIIVSVLYARFGAAVRPYQSRIITPIFVILIILQLVGTVPGFTTLAETPIDLGITSVILRRLFFALLVLYVFIVSAWVVEQIMVHSLPNRLNAEPGVIESFATLTRYALLALGTLVFLGILGLDFTSLAIVAGGLSVGIGIGLQDLVANFVSGIVLLFEQSLKPGDVVELDGRISQVQKISLRATTVRTITNEELIIPNASFTTTQVKNLTKSDRVVRIGVPFGVSYKSNPGMVRQLAVETSEQHPLVLSDPPPKLMFRGYGDSSIDFELMISTNQPEISMMIRSDLYYMLWDTLAEHDISIPFPQRDLNLGDGWEKLSAHPQAKAAGPDSDPDTDPDPGKS